MITGVGGTNLYGVESHDVIKHKSLIINKLCFAISSLRGRWRFVPPKPATSGVRYPAKGLKNCVAPYKSLQGDLYPYGCNSQIKCAMTINPRGHPSDKVSNTYYSAPPQSSAATPERLLVFAVDWQELLHTLSQSIRITEGVSATANAVSEEEKLRKLCGYSVNAVRLPDVN